MRALVVRHVCRPLRRCLQLVCMVRARAADRPRAKGAVDCPPCGKTAIFRRAGMSEQWAIGGVCRWLLVVFGSTRPKQNPQKQIRRVWAGFSVGDITPGFRKIPLLGCSNKGRRGFVLYVTQGPQIHSLFVAAPQLRLGRQP